MTLLLSQPAFATDTTNLQRQGVKAYKAGKYEQAQDLFSQAAAKKPEDATALYNHGTALYKLGEFSKATQAFAASAEALKNKKTRAKAEYNQGRALLAEAKASKDAAKKKELLLAASQAFQLALHDDPRLKPTRKGIEDFRKEYAKINQQPPANKQNQGKQQQQKDQGQDQQQNQGGQGQGQQDLQKQLNEAGQKQQNMANQSKKASSDSKQQGSNKKQLGDMAAQQQSVRQALEKIKEELRKDQPGKVEGDQDKKDLANNLDQAINKQKKAEDSLKKGDLNQAQKQQQQAADSLKEMAANQATNQKDKTEQSASAAVDKKNKADDTKDAASAHNQQQVEEDRQNKEGEKANSTVTDILDGEKALHEMRRLRMKQQRPASGKDW